MSKPDMAAAEHFMAADGRIVDRRRFDRLFADGSAVPVRDAVAAYRNTDGGFGHALEPDCRAPGSQPAATEMALRIMDEASAWDDDLVGGALDWLQSIAPAEGGSTFVEPTIDGWPHAPWWAPEDGRPASLISTGMIAGTLHARKVSHPWLDRATELMWSRIDDLADPGPYGMRGVLGFLDHVPDRERAGQAVARIAPALSKIVTLDPDAGGEVHSPLDFAPLPDSAARTLFSAEVIEAHLDHLVAGQHPDGGWTFNWLSWSPAADAGWRGFLTVDALCTLRANGRIG
ncbi:MAG TPA: hypothetical protein VGI64_19630 [Streptosporangiaceae bacterium]